MTRFYRRFWRRKRKNQGPFGGRIASRDEVKKLHDRIVEAEKENFESFEKEFDEQLKNI